MARPPASLLAWGGPIGWVVDKVAGFIGDVATAGFELVIGGLVAWITDAVIWVVAGVFNYFIDAQDPNVQADWFVSGDGPYATTATIGATLMVAFVLAGIAQGALQGDVGGMLKRMALDLPMSVLGIVGLVTITQALIRLTDVLSTWVMANFEQDIADFTAVVTSLSRLGGGPASAFVVFVLGLVTVLAGLALVAELAVRAALVYIVVAFAPFVFAAQLWPSLKGIGQKLLRLLCGLILAKLAMAVALSVAAAAAVGAGSGGEVTALPESEIFAEDPGGSVTQAVGILLAAMAAFLVAAFMPFFVAKLLPIAEEAAVAQGLRSGPLRSAQQGMSMAYYAETIPRLAKQLRSRRAPRSTPPGPTPPQDNAQGPKALNPGPSGPKALPAGPGPKGALGMGGARPMPPGGGGAAPSGGGRAAGGAGGAGGAAAAAGPAGVAVAATVGVAKTVKGMVDRGIQTAGRTANAATGNTSASSSPPPTDTGSPRQAQPSSPSSGRSKAAPKRPPRPPGSASGGAP